MKLFNRLEIRAIPPQSEQPQQSNNGVAGQRFWSYQQFNKAGAMNISTFFQCTDLISSSIAQLPIKVKAIESKEEDTVLTNHPLNMVLDGKDLFINRFTMVKTIIQSIILTGNAYLKIERGANGIIKSLQFLESSDVNIIYNKAMKEKKLHYVVSNTSIQNVVNPEDMLHFKMWSNDGVKGISLIAYANQEISIGGFGEQYAFNSFQNAGNQTSVVIETDTPVSANQKQQIINSWTNNMTQGEGGIVVMNAGQRAKQWSLTPADSQLLESRQFNAEMLCHFLNVNPAIIGLKGYTQPKTFEDSQNELLTRTLAPFIRMMEEEFKRKLVGENEDIKIIFDVSSMLRMSKQSEANYYGTLLDKGVLSRNEVRKILGYPTIEGLDEYLIAYTDTSMNNIKNEQDKDNE